MTVFNRLRTSMPPEFDEDRYRDLNGDLARLSGEHLRSHYAQHGIAEGRRSHSLADRGAFIGLIPGDAEALEIGPFHAPLLGGARIRYFDVLDRAGLLARARQIGYPTERIPEKIHFVSPSGDLGVVAQGFDVVVSSHVIEHQPDFIGHLRAVERVLRPGGFYFLLIPDKNYCFDHFIAESTIADLLDAHLTRRKIHTLRSQIEHAALTTHNDPKRHWAGDHGLPSQTEQRIATAIASYRQDPLKYVDVHAWYFTPASFRAALSMLGNLAYTALTVARVYPTLLNNNEFWAVLELKPR